MTPEMISGIAQIDGFRMIPLEVGDVFSLKISDEDGLKCIHINN